MKSPPTKSHGTAHRRHWVEQQPTAALAVVALMLAIAPLRAASFTATLDRDTVALGESATLSLKFEGDAPKDAPSPPEIANLQISYIGPSSQFSFINGHVSSTVTYNFTVTPQQVGEFTIPSLSAVVGNQRLTSPALRLKVLKPGAPPPEAVNSGSEPAFLKLVLSKKEVYLGEVITAELQFYFRQGVQLADQPRLTAIPTDGLGQGKLVVGQQRQVQIGSAVYTIIPATMTLTAQRTGPLSIGPVTASVTLEIPSTRPRRDSFFDPFGMFDRGEQKQIAIATDLETVQSLPLPAEHVPPGFNGAIGDYTLAVTAGPTNVSAGDPVTVRVQIAGRGALDALGMPEQPGWRDFKTYPPTAKLETSDALGTQGTKTFEQIVTPQSADVHELPPFSFSFFDPDGKAYRTLTQPPIPLSVRPGGATAVPVVAAARSAAAENPPPQQDLVPIKQRPGVLARIGPPLVMQPWFAAMQGAPILAWMAALVWRKRTEALASNPRLRRQRQVARRIRRGLDDLNRFAAEKKSDEFFATLFHLLQEQLGERLDCPATSITEAVIDEKLRPRGVAEDTLTAVHELFQTCNLARYAPIQTSQELAAIIPRLEGVLRKLQEVEA